MKILTIYDGTVQSKDVLRYGLRKAKGQGGKLIVLQVFPSNLFLDYDAHPRAEEMGRSDADRFRRDAEAIISDAGKGNSVRFYYEEGDAIEEALRVAAEERPDLILATRRYQKIAKKSPAPVYTMPGTILVAVEGSAGLKTELETIIAEAKASGSGVLLVGVVPVHLYSSSEKEELDRIKKATAAALDKIQKSLNEKGIEAGKDLRSGYPDEEILKSAEEHDVSLIMLPHEGTIRSELAKAAAILLGEPDRVKRPLFLMPSGA